MAQRLLHQCECSTPARLTEGPTAGLTAGLTAGFTAAQRDEVEAGRDGSGASAWMGFRVDLSELVNGD